MQKRVTEYSRQVPEKTDPPTAPVSNAVDLDKTDPQKAEPERTEPQQSEPQTTEPKTTEPQTTESRKAEPEKTASKAEGEVGANHCSPLQSFRP